MANQELTAGNVQVIKDVASVDFPMASGANDANLYISQENAVSPGFARYARKYLGTRYFTEKPPTPHFTAEYEATNWDSGWVWQGEYWYKGSPGYFNNQDLINTEVDSIALQWDTSTIPDNAYIAEAYLTLNIVGYSGGTLQRSEYDASLVGTWGAFGTLGKEDHVHVPDFSKFALRVPFREIYPLKRIEIKLSNPNEFVNRLGFTGLRLNPHPLTKAGEYGANFHVYESNSALAPKLTVVYGTLDDWPKRGWLKAEYFPGNAEQHYDPPGYPNLTRPEARPLAYNWGTSVPGGATGEFKVKYSGWLYFPGGVYEFVAKADDGFMLYLGDTFIFDYWEATTFEHRVQRRINEGWHNLIFRYYNYAGDASFNFDWRLLSWDAQTTIPESEFIRGG